MTYNIHIYILKRMYIMFVHLYTCVCIYIYLLVYISILLFLCIQMYRHVYFISYITYLHTNTYIDLSGRLVNLSFFQAITSPSNMAERKTEKAKAPQKHQKLQKREIQHHATENVCLKDTYTVNLWKKKSLIFIHTITVLYAKAPVPFYSNHVIQCLN